MSSTIKPLGTEQTFTSANSFANAACVRIVATTTGTNSLITRAYANGTTIATFTIIGGTEVSVEKSFTDTLTSNNATALGVAVAFTN